MKDFVLNWSHCAKMAITIFVIGFVCYDNPEKFDIVFLTLLACNGWIGWAFENYYHEKLKLKHDVLEKDSK